MSTSTTITTKIYSSIARVVYLVMRMYLGVAIRLGRLATIGFLVTSFLAAGMLRHAVGMFVLTFAHYLAMRALDAGYVRFVAFLYRPRKPQAAVVPAAPRAAVAPVARIKPAAPRPMELKLVAVRISDFSYLHA